MTISRRDANMKMPEIQAFFDGMITARGAGTRGTRDFHASLKKRASLIFFGGKSHAIVTVQSFDRNLRYE